MVNPVGQRAVDEVVDWQRIPLRVEDEILSDHALLLLLTLLVELVEADGGDVRAGGDASDLSAEVVHLSARERRVAHDLNSTVRVKLGYIIVRSKA